MIDMGLKLKCLRELRGLTQKDLARESAVGEKSISSFETGQRLGSLKVSHLIALLNVLNVTLAEFVIWDPQEISAPIHVVPEVSDLPTSVEPTRRRSLPADPLRGIRREDPRLPSLQSSLARAM